VETGIQNIAEDGLGAPYRSGIFTKYCQAAAGAPVIASHCGGSGRGLYCEIQVN